MNDKVDAQGKRHKLAVTLFCSALLFLFLVVVIANTIQKQREVSSFTTLTFWEDSFSSSITGALIGIEAEGNESSAAQGWNIKISPHSNSTGEGIPISEERIRGEVAPVGGKASAGRAFSLGVVLGLNLIYGVILAVLLAGIKIWYSSRKVPRSAKRKRVLPRKGSRIHQIKEGIVAYRRVVMVLLAFAIVGIGGYLIMTSEAKGVISSIVLSSWYYFILLLSIIAAIITLGLVLRRVSVELKEIVVGVLSYLQQRWALTLVIIVMGLIVTGVYLLRIRLLQSAIIITEWLAQQWMYFALWLLGTFALVLIVLILRQQRKIQKEVAVQETLYLPLAPEPKAPPVLEKKKPLDLQLEEINQQLSTLRYGEELKKPIERVRKLEKCTPGERKLQKEVEEINRKMISMEAPPLITRHRRDASLKENVRERLPHQELETVSQDLQGYGQKKSFPLLQSETRGALDKELAKVEEKLGQLQNQDFRKARVISSSSVTRGHSGMDEPIHRYHNHRRRTPAFQRKK